MQTQFGRIPAINTGSRFWVLGSRRKPKTQNPEPELIMSIEIGISTGFFYAQDLIKSLPLIQLSGFKHLEIWGGPEKNGEYIHYRWHRPEYTQELLFHLEKLELSVFSLHAPYYSELDISDLDEDKRKFAVKEIQRIAQILKHLNGKVLVIHSAVKEFDLRNFPQRRARFEQCKKSLTEISAIVRELNLKVALETLLPHILGGQIEVLQELLAGFDKNYLGICFDTSHVRLWPEVNLNTVLEKLAPQIIAFHISDNYGKYDDHFPLGEGTIHWPSFFETLKRVNYQGVLTLEVLNNPKLGEPEIVLPQIYKKIENYLEKIDSGAKI